MIAPELMRHVAIPSSWKKFVFHRGCSLNIKSILETGQLQEEEKARREDILSSSQLSMLFGEDADEEEPSDDISVLRKVHHHSN